MSANAYRSGHEVWLRLLGHLYGWRQSRWLSQLDYAPKERIRAVQDRKLERLLTHAATHVPYYRDLFDRLKIDLDKAGPRATLQSLPLLLKSDIEANFPDRILSGGRRPLTARHVTTSGTTSDRVEVVLTLAAQHQRHAQQLWADEVGGGCALGFRRLEIPPDACSRVCGQAAERPEGLLAEMRWAAKRSARPARAAGDAFARRIREALRNTILNDTTLPPLMGPGGTGGNHEDITDLIDTIGRERPYLVSGLPTYLQEIVRHLEKTGGQLDVPVVRPIGSVSTPEMKREIARGFGAQVFETYGSNELGSVAAECDAHDGLHVCSGGFVLEVLRDGRPAAPGELGRFAITCLDNYAMPLIRYDIGDVGRWYEADCRCGRNTPLIECHGRLQALIVTDTGNAVTEEQVMSLAYTKLGLEHFQLVERRPGRFHLMFVSPRGKTVDIDTVAAAFDRMLDGPEDIEIFPVDTIYPEATGKFRFVKSASWERFV